MSVERIAFADTLTAAYREDPSRALLNQVWAAIYTPAGLRWKASRIERMAWWARLVPRRIKLAAMLNYRGMLLANMDRFPEVYKGGTTDGTEVFGWEGTIQRLAKAQTFGPYQQAKDILFLQAMTHFSINAIEIKNLEREREKHKNK